MNCDIYLVGVGGQGILTIGEILASTAQRQGMPVSFFPSKGMAQRGGFVKAQLRLGRAAAGPNIPEGRADVVIAMELSESLKAVKYVKKGGVFLLYGERWEPTAVMLKKAPYPEFEAVRAEVLAAGAALLHLDPAGLPERNGRKVADNIFLLGAALKHTPLGMLFEKDKVLVEVCDRWPKAADANRFAFEAGLQSNIVPESAPGGAA